MVLSEPWWSTSRSELRSRNPRKLAGLKYERWGELSPRCQSLSRGPEIPKRSSISAVRYSTPSELGRFRTSNPSSHIRLRAAANESMGSGRCSKTSLNTTMSKGPFDLRSPGKKPWSTTKPQERAFAAALSSGSTPRTNAPRELASCRKRPVEHPTSKSRVPCKLRSLSTESSKHEKFCLRSSSIPLTGAPAPGVSAEPRNPQLGHRVSQPFVAAISAPQQIHVWLPFKVTPPRLRILE